MTVFVDWLALIITATAAIGLLISRDWRWEIGLLAGMYLGVFWLLQAHWLVTVAAAKLVTGWMACAMLATARISSAERSAVETDWPHGRLFLVLTAALVAAASFALAVRLTSWLGISIPTAWGSLLLMGLGLIHLGIRTDPFRVVIGLLTVLAGFQVLYAAVENSTLVAASLSVITLGLAMAGAYFESSAAEEAP
jgi:hypothetical protein